MKSPFPGMDPFIEGCGLFEDFHDALIHELHVAIAASLPERYVVRIGERPYVVIAETNGKEEHVFKPDVGIVASPREANNVGNGGIAVAAAAVDVGAVSMRAFIATEYRETFLDIFITEPERILVTCIEVLSPSNKRRNSEGWNTYLRKRQGLLLGAASLVEIDLLRRGERFPMLDSWPNSPYSLLVARRTRAPYCQVWPAHFNNRLPVIPVPLVSPDPDVELDLQPMIDAVYARSRYYQDIDYAKPLTPPLTADESNWFAERLRQITSSTKPPEHT